MKSKFENLNYGQVYQGLEELDTTKEQQSTSKGIVLSVRNFQGNIELLDNTIANNIVFIPAAEYTNRPKYNQTHVDPEIDDFIKNFPEGNNQEIFGHVLYFIIKSTSKYITSDMSFFNYYNNKDFEHTLKTKFKT